MGSDLFNRMRQLAAQLGRNDLSEGQRRELVKHSTELWRKAMGEHIVTENGLPLRETGGRRGSRENEQS